MVSESNPAKRKRTRADYNSAGRIKRRAAIRQAIARMKSDKITIERFRNLLPPKYAAMSDTRITSLLSSEPDMINLEPYVWKRVGGQSST